ncbi:tubulin-specific chaperone C-like isoform X1 [Clytia hemisphaerica]|uniref:C-CAP/cofactor C-like domain-containing protein n=1 Tax=Clytia hemisphaerica TaxID=252671 RepID=A0A7M5XIL9_9CNID
MGDEEYQETLQRKHQERLAQFEVRRQERLAHYAAKKQTRTHHTENSNETAEAFLETFNKEKRQILHQLNELTDKTPVFERAAKFDVILLNISNIWKFISDSLAFLPNYDVRRAQDIVKEVRLQVIEKRDLLMPKKKFAFKSRQRLTPSKTKKDKPSEEKNTISVITSLSSSNVGFSDRLDETLNLDSNECTGKDLNLSNISNCTIYIKGAPSAMRLNNVINSRVFCGPIARSIFVNDCIDSELNLACQQLRIHTSINSKFFVHVTSKVIIEDCEELSFGKYIFHYETIEEDFENSKLPRDVNNWRDVDDFNWLKLDEPSPNWSLIEC